MSQSNGPLPLLELPGYIFRKIVVDQVVDVSGTRHEVMFVTAHKEGTCFVLFSCIASPVLNDHYLSNSNVTYASIDPLPSIPSHSNVAKI